MFLLAICIVDEVEGVCAVSLTCALLADETSAGAVALVVALEMTVSWSDLSDQMSYLPTGQGLGKHIVISTELFKGLPRLTEALDAAFMQVLSNHADIPETTLGSMCFCRLGPAERRSLFSTAPSRATSTTNHISYMQTKLFRIRVSAESVILSATSDLMSEI